MKASVLTMAIIFGMAGCANNETGIAEHALGKAKLLVIGYDISGSAQQLDSVTPAHLRQLVSAMDSTRDDLAFGFITAASNETIHRLSLRRNPGKMPLGLRQKLEFQTEERRQRKLFAKKKAAFIADVNSAILQGRNQSHTDIEGFLQRVAVLVNEPQFQDYDIHMLLITDGKDTVHKTISTIPPGNIYLLGWADGEHARQLFSKPIFFESLNGFLHFFTITNPMILGDINNE